MLKREGSDEYLCLHVKGEMADREEGAAAVVEIH